MQMATQAARCGRPCLGLRHNADQLAEMLRLDFNQVRGFETGKSQFETEKSQFETEKSQFDTEKCQFSGQAQARAGARWG
jgi:hypothetical protein